MTFLLLYFTTENILIDNTYKSFKKKLNEVAKAFEWSILMRYSHNRWPLTKWFCVALSILEVNCAKASISANYANSNFYLPPTCFMALIWAVDQEGKIWPIISSI